MSKRIYLTEHQYNLIKEAEFNYHINRNSDKEHSLQPYQSDNKYVMDGRGTGHFGSGTYFSTYKEEDPKIDSQYGKNNQNTDKQFIQIGDGVYRVDLELYKNLYRVENVRQADVLYSLLRYLNQMFCRICSFGKFRGKDAIYDNSDLYQRIIRNANALNLQCPSYLTLTRMMQNHGQNDEKQSFSTVFMEYNGYNGVNVSGIPMYDNTMHGSVIYDLSKLGDDTIQQVKPNSLWDVEGSYQNTTVKSPKNGELWDNELDALNGKHTFWVDKLNDMPLNQALRLLKNYVKGNGEQLDNYYLQKMSLELRKRYLKILFKSNKDNIEVKKLINAIKETKSYYWVNYLDEYYEKSGLLALLHDFEFELDWDLPDEEADKERQKYLNNLMLYLNRNLASFEKKWLKKNGYIDFDEEKDNEAIVENKTNELSHDFLSKVTQTAFDNDDERVRKFRYGVIDAIKRSDSSFASFARTDGEEKDKPFLNVNKNAKIISYDSDYQTLEDLYRGVKQGKLLIHCRKMQGEETERVIYPEIGETVQEFYGEYLDNEEYGNDVLKELIFASDDFSWAKNSRNGVYFIYSDNFVRSLGDGRVQEPDGTIYHNENLSASVESGDWFSEYEANVAAVLVNPLNKNINESRGVSDEHSRNGKTYNKLLC